MIQGTVSIGCGESSSVGLLPGLFQEFRERCPLVQWFERSFQKLQPAVICSLTANAASARLWLRITGKTPHSIQIGRGGI